MHYLEEDLKNQLSSDPHLFYLITEHSHDGLWYWDLENPEEEWFSPSFWETFGYDPQEKPAKSSAWQGMVDAEDYAKAEALIQEHLSNPEKPYRQTLGYRHRQGHKVWIRCVGQAILKDGKPIRMVGAHIDVTNEVKVNEDFANLFYHSPDLILIADAKQKVTQANPGIIRLLGGKQNLLGKDLQDTLAENEIGLNLAELKEEGKPRTFTLELSSPEYLQFQISLWWSGANYFLVGKNETELKKQQAARQKQEELKDLILGIANNFIEAKLSEIPAMIEATLAEVGHYVNADRSYIFDYDFKRETTTNTYEWCREGIDPQIENLQDVPMSLFPQWLDCHLKGETMYIPDVHDYPDRELGEFLAAQSITSLLAVPIYGENRCLGFIGFDWVTSEKAYQKEDEDILQVFGSMLGQLQLRARNQQQLQDSFTLNNRIIDEVRSPIIVADPEGNIEIVNEAFCQLTGFKKEALLQDQVPYCFWPKHRASQYQSQFQEVLQEKITSLEISLLTAGEEEIPTKADFDLIKGEEGELRYLLVTMFDLRAEKRLQADLQREQAFAEMLLDQSPIYIFAMDRKGSLTDLNKNLLDALHAGQDSFIGQPAFRLCHEGDALRLSQQISRLEQGEDSRITLQHNFPGTGQEHLIEWTFTPQKGKEGQRWIAFGMDVTQERNQRAELEQSQEKLKKAQQIARMGSWEINLANGQRYWSEELYKLLEIPTEQPATQAYFLDRVKPQERERVLEQLSLAQEGEMDYTLKYHYHKSGGTELILKDIGKVERDLNGKPLRVLGTTQDITFEEKTRQELSHYQSSLERRNILADLLSRINGLLLSSDDWDQALKLSLKHLGKELESTRAFAYAIKAQPEGGFYAYFQSQWAPKSYNNRLQTPKRISKIPHEGWENLINRLVREKCLFTNHEAKLNLAKLPAVFPWQDLNNVVLVGIVWDKKLVGLIGLEELPDQALDAALRNNLKILAQNLAASFNVYQSVNQLQRSNERFRILNDLSKDSMYELDINSQTLSFTRHMSKILAADAVHINAINKRIHEADRPKVIKARKQLQEGLKDKAAEIYRIQRPNHQWVTVEESMQLVRDIGQHPVSIIGVIRPHSEIQLQGKLIDNALTQAALAPLEVDFETGQIRHSDSLYAILDLPEGKEIDLDQGITQFYLDDQWVYLKGALPFIQKGGISQTVLAYTFQERYKWLQVSLESEKLDEGLLRSKGYIQDVTEQVEQEKNYKQLNYWLRRSQEQSQMGNFIVAPKTGQWTLSDTLVELLKIPSDFSAHDWLELIVPAYRQQASQHIRKLFKRGEKVSFETLVKEGGQADHLRWVTITVETYHNQGQNEIAGTVQDITARKRYEQELEIINSRLSKMAWEQSHLARAPLSKVLSFTEEIEQGLKQGTSPESIQEDLESLKSSAQELDQALRNLIQDSPVLQAESPTQLEADAVTLKQEHKAHQFIITDDDPLVRKLYSKILSQGGLLEEPLVFEDGKPLLDYFLALETQEKPFLVLLDLNMPGWDGWQTLDKIHGHFKNPESKQCRVIILTSSPNQTDRRRALTYPLVVDYIEKPLNKEKVEQLKRHDFLTSSFK
jgi:PAS domain S-box-containing protein